MTSVGCTHNAWLKAMLCLSLFSLVKTMCNITNIRFGFCGIRKNQGLGNCRRPRLKTLFSSSIIPDTTKTGLKCEHVTSRNGKNSFYKSITVILPAVNLCIYSSKNFRLTQSQLSVFPPNSFDCIGPIFRIF